MKAEPKRLANKGSEWRRLEGGLSHVDVDLNRSVGLYRVILRSKVVYVGCATECANGGLMKRLRDFTRSSASGRSHHAGGLIFEHRNEVEIEVLVTGQNALAGIAARQLKSRLLKQGMPLWNVTPHSQSVLDGARRSAG